MNIGVVGLGKLGLPLFSLLVEAGHNVIGYDKSNELISKLQAGNFNYNEPELNELLFENSEKLKFTSKLGDLVQNSELIFIIVPTPSDATGYFSNHLIISICDEIGKLVSQNPKFLTIDIVSTVMPGSCEGEITLALQNSSGMKIGEDLGICYNPEFIALGSVIQNMRYPDMQLLGANSNTHAEVVEKAISTFTKSKVPIRRMSLTEAELVKIAVNNFVTMKISFANMLGMLSSRIGNLNVDVVTEAIGLDSRIGNKYLKQAAPFGGPCFPRDTKALSALLNEFQISDSLPKTVSEINKTFLNFILDEISVRAKSLKIGVLGLSYKPYTPVIEESPGIAILQKLYEEKHDVIGWDPDMSHAMESSLPLAQNFEDFIQNIQFCVITRPVPELKDSEIESIQNLKNVLDLWRSVQK